MTHFKVQGNHRRARQLTAETLYYNGSSTVITAAKPGAAMLQHPLRPLPSPEAGRPAVVAIRPSVLRLGLGARLARAACLLAGIWGLLGWVLR